VISTKIYFQTYWITQHPSFKLNFEKERFMYNIDMQNEWSNTLTPPIRFHVVDGANIMFPSNVTVQGYSKWLSGVQMSCGNSAPNSGNNHHLTIPFEAVMHRFKRQGACVSLNWRYESEPPLKPSPLTCYRQFGTNSIIVLMFVDSQRLHI